jgi:parvulin-like peptidyl-prolyl isomerase
MLKLRNLVNAGALVVVGSALVPFTSPSGAQSPLPVKPDDKPQIVAHVNGVPITRQELAEEMIARRGKKELELLINRRIIHQAGQQAGVTVTDAEIDDEIRDTMRLGQFRSMRDFEEQFLKKERGCTLFEFREDVVRPALIVRKIAGQQVQATEAELRQAFDAQFGPRVQCCIILEKQRNVALADYQKIAGDPKTFYAVAKTQADPRLAATAGRINPVGRHTTYPIVEQRAFEMQDGEISEVLQVPEGFVIVLREHAVEPEQGKSFEKEREALKVEVETRKLRALTPKLFKELRDKADVKDLLNERSSKGLIEAIEKSQGVKGAPAKRP